MGRFVGLFLLDCPEVPYFGFLVLFEQFVVDSDVVVARHVLRVDLGALLVPLDRLLVVLLLRPVANPHLVGHPRVLLVQPPGLLEIPDLLFDVPLVASNDEPRVLVPVVVLECPLRPVEGLGLFDALVLEGEGEVYVGLDKLWLELDDLLVVLDCFLVDAVIVEDVGVAVDDLVVAGVFPGHLCVPLDALLVLGVVVAAERQSVVGRTVEYLRLAGLGVPAEGVPLVEAHLLLVVADALDVVVGLGVVLDDALVDVDGQLEVLQLEEAVGEGFGLAVVRPVAALDPLGAQLLGGELLD